MIGEEGRCIVVLAYVHDLLFVVLFAMGNCSYETVPWNYLFVIVSIAVVDGVRGRVPASVCDCDAELNPSFNNAT